VVAVVGLLSLNTVLFYLPHAVARRVNFTDLPGGEQIALPFVQVGLFGPRLTGIPEPALVLTDSWEIYNALLASLNCPGFTAEGATCPVLFALAPTPADADRLQAAYGANRTILRAVQVGGTLELRPSP
jgi:hypothetical protein